MYKSILLLTAIISTSFASPAVMGGISYKFGDSNSTLSGAGATLKVLSSDEEKKPVVGAGVSYYPWAENSNKFGIDVSAGYNFKNGAVMGGWDFLQNQPNVSLGYSKGVSDDTDSQFVDGIQDATCTASK